MQACEPTAYYHRSGPAGDILGNATKSEQKVLVIGLGVGSLACFAQADQSWTFYELNPAMQQVAQDSNLFTFLQNSPTKNLEIHLGDGRRLLKESNKSFDSIVVDAFSSDAIPVHLITKEAFQLYLAHLNSDGRILVHISNRFFDLTHVLGRISQELNLISFIREDLNVDSALSLEGKTPSTWVVLSRKEVMSEAINPTWRQLSEKDARLWTDDFSDPVSVIKPSLFSIDN